MGCYATCACEIVDVHQIEGDADISCVFFFYETGLNLRETICFIRGMQHFRVCRLGKYSTRPSDSEGACRRREESLGLLSHTTALNFSPS